ncbi:MAG: DNA topoisomerase (ATP-hydrolyzing) subunit A [Spirochaetaceae bacterium]|nr:DNA topoisomerase (ATP-hydrolyzing) subunit A [Spirochaetaceae bacterium]
MNEPTTEKITSISIEEELKKSYLTYAMSVIISRALPDVRDGLKPVHRRILHVLNELKLDNSAKTKKGALIVGEVMGKYHPHGDAAIYDTLVRLAQSFSLRYPLVQGQGNFGSIEGDPPAAMRYTEAKMAKLCEAMLRDIKKETVSWQPTYDGSLDEPTVLPTALPNLLVNGSSGIAVGMATNMAPHNLSEVVEAIIATIDNPDITIEELLHYVKGPDFPTGAIVYGKSGFRKAAFTGRGSVMVRAKVEIEEHKNHEQIIITQLPYMTNMKSLLTSMADLVKDKTIEAISEIRNESKKDVRIVIEIKRGYDASVVLNQLYQNTSLQASFSINNIALVNGEPLQLNLKDLITHFIAHRKEVIVKRTKFDLRKLREREHILQGYKIALENIDAIIQLIKESLNTATARERLMSGYGLSEIQAQAILDMRLQRLTGLEVQKIIDELAEIVRNIAGLEELLADESKQYNVIKEESLALKLQYGDERRTELLPDEIQDITNEDLIESEDMLVLISKQGFIKRVPLSDYKEQGRGGKGSLSAKLGDGDYVSHIFSGNTHDILFFVTTKGKGYWLKVYQVPLGSKTTKGKHLKTIFEFEADEEISETICFSEFDNRYLFMATRLGVVKRVELNAFKNAKTRGIIAINLDEGDSLQKVELTTGENHIILASRFGKALRIDENAVRVMGRTAGGVRGIKLAEGDELIGLSVANADTSIFVLTENGYGKRVDFEQFAPHGRATAGQRLANTKGKFGNILEAASCNESDSVLVITESGKTIKVALSQIRLLSRTAGGVRIIKTENEDKIVGMAFAEGDMLEADEEVATINYEQAELFGEDEGDGEE